MFYFFRYQLWSAKKNTDMILALKICQKTKVEQEDIAALDVLMKKDMKMDDMELLRSSYIDEGGVEHLFSQGKSMQLLFYAYIYMQMMKEKGENIDSVRVGIESLRKPDEGTMMLTLDGREDISLDDMEKYEERIKGVIREMMDKDVPYLELGTIYYDILS